MRTKRTKENVTISGLTRSAKCANGWATGKNGWRFEFTVTPGIIEIDTREHTESDAKADERQIRQCLTECFPDILNG